MRVRISIRQGALIPRGYGVAWVDDEYRQIVCLPLGINLVVRWLRNAWHWTKASYQPSVLDTIWEAGYTAGRHDERRRRDADVAAVAERIRAGQLEPKETRK